MSFTIITILRCDECYDKEIKLIGPKTQKQEAEKKAVMEQGWVTVNSKHYCPKCTEIRRAT